MAVSLVRVVDRMGDDGAVVQAARVSYGAGTRGVLDDERLIRYLMRHRHTSPFEMCEIKLHVRCPIFVARQWLRHRTASVNEVSGRYSVLGGDFFVPEHVYGQSVGNRQGRGEEPIDGDEEARRLIEESYGEAARAYGRLLWMGASREQARMVLPLATYTEFYWKIDLHNLLHFLELRLHPTAQEEIRVYAEEIAGIVREWVPITWRAFEDYRLRAVTLSRQEYEALRSVLRGEKPDLSVLSRRERVEFLEKFPEVVDEGVGSSVG